MKRYAETLMARVTGLPRRTISETRKSRALKKDSDWVLENACVHYTEAGLEKICGALGITAATLQWPEPAAEPAVAEIEASAATGDPLADELEGDQNVEKISAEPGAGQPPDAPAAAAVAAAVAQLEAATPELIAVRVSRVSPNPRVLIGLVDAKPVTVLVRDNRNFRSGMTLRAHRMSNVQFSMVGNCPRWPGRW